MRFRTVIKLVSDAKNKNEALEVVEEYLAGNIVSGVDMKCITRPIYDKAKITGIGVLILAVCAGIYMVSNVKHVTVSMPLVSGVSAVQPPLNTSCNVQDRAHFKKDWQDRHTKEALDYITK